MNTIHRSQGRYYLGEREEQACYIFQLREDAPKTLERSYIITLEHDYGWKGSPLEVARGIMEMWEDFFLAPKLPKIKELVSYLKEWEKQDMFDSLTHEKSRIKKRLEEIEHELVELV